MTRESGLTARRSAPDKLDVTARHGPQHMRHLRRPRHLATILTATLTLACGLAVATALWSAGAASPAAARDGGTVRLGDVTKGLMGGSDWYHALDVIAAVAKAPPEVPLVVLVGGSCARECTVGDGDWATQVDRRGGPPVVTYNIGSRNQTFYEDVALVKGLPAQVPTIVYIGVNMGRFTSPYTRKDVPLTPDPDKSARHSQHHYSRTRILTLAQKKALIPDWLTRRYPVFKARFKYNLGQLERLVRACKRRGFHPVLLELPRNMAVIGGAFDRPIQRYHRGCKALAWKHGVPFVNFVRAARLVNRDFFDLAHLVEPGRVKFQRLLSDRTVRLLKRYDMVPEPMPSPSPSTGPSTSASPKPSPSASLPGA